MQDRRGVRRVLLISLAIIATTVVALPSTASAAEQNAYAAAMSYATPAVTIAAGDTVTFHNLDTLAKHDIVGHDGRSPAS